MRSIISSVQAQAIEIVNKRRGTINKPLSYILAPFNDPSVPDPIITGDVDQFITSISALTAFGGGDCPELAMQGLLGAIQASSDGGAKDLNLVNEVKIEAKVKRVKVYNFLFPSFYQSPTDFKDVSYICGGIAIDANVVEAGTLVQIADLALSNKSLTLELYKTYSGSAFKRLRHQTTGLKTYEISVDSSITNLDLLVGGLDLGLTVTRPDGSVLVVDDKDVIITLSGSIIVDITDPIPGIWKATVSGTNTTLSIGRQGDVYLSSCEFLEFRGEAHPSYFPLDDDPIPSTNGVLTCSLADEFTSAHFEFRSDTGTLLNSFDLSCGTGGDYGLLTNSFFGNVTVSCLTYIIYVNGELPSGEMFTRVDPRVYVVPESNGTCTYNSTTHMSGVSVIYPNATSWTSAPFTNATSTKTIHTNSTATCANFGYCRPTVSTSFSGNYPTAPCPPPPVLTITMRVITVVNKCPVVEILTIGSETTCRTTLTESMEYITTTHLDICKTQAAGPNTSISSAPTGLSGSGGGVPGNGVISPSATVFKGAGVRVALDTIAWLGVTLLFVMFLL